MTDLEIGSIVVFVIAVCQAIKFAGFPSRFIPLVSLLLATGASVFLGGNNWLSVASGILLGLTSSGLYDFGKVTVLGK